MNDCIMLLIPVINEVFDKHYTGSEKIIQHPNEHFINQQDGESQKRITDSSFTIIDKDGHEEHFIIEVQSTPDNSMIIRIFEYATQIALDAAVIENNKMTVSIPNASIIFLRSNSATPDNMIIEIKTSGGNVSFTVPVLKVKSYSLSDILDKRLYFLLPFYIFNREKNFPIYNNNESELEKLKQEYNKFMSGLDKAVDNGEISVYYRRVIIDMSKKVLENIARKYYNLQRGVNAVMGGRVLEHEGKIILNQGIAIGRQEANLATARRLRNAGMSDDDICKFADVSYEDLKML